MALPKKYRLKGRLVFQNIKRRGDIFQSESFGLGIFSRDDSGVSRFGVVVSSKISKKATVRNRLRRIIFGVLIEMLARIEKGYDIVFLVKPKILYKEKSGLKDEIVNLFKKAKLI